MAAHRDRRARVWPKFAHPALAGLEVEHLVVDVTAKGVAGVVRLEAAPCGRRTVDVLPALGPRRRGMNVADRRLPGEQRQAREEALLLGGERVAGPLQRRLRGVVEVARAPVDGLVVVAL